MRDICQIIRDKDTTALGARGRFDNPAFLRIALHVLLEIDKLIWQDECLWDEAKVFGAVDFSEFGYLAVH